MSNPKEFKGTNKVNSIIVDKMKLIKFYDNNEIKLYNLKNDINENENLYKKVFVSVT